MNRSTNELIHIKIKIESILLKGVEDGCSPDLYERSFLRWRYIYSDVAKVNGKELHGHERFILLIKADSVGLKCQISDTFRGIPLTEELFIQESVRHLSDIYDKTLGRPAYREYNYRAPLFIDYIKLRGERLNSNNREKDNTNKLQRRIDADKLKPYFTSTFKGMGNGNLNNFDTMIDELKTDRTAREFAQIAFMIYVSNKLSDRKPNTFTKWYGIFCECVGCDKKTYKPKDLNTIPEKTKQLFSYL